MVQHNFVTYSGKIVVKLLGEIIYFPVWWYSVGFFRAVKSIWSFWRGQEQALGFLVWAKNWLRPMYGQYDFAGRVISFLVRTVQIICRGFVLLIWLIICLLAMLVWLALPILLFLALAFQFIK